MNVIARLEYELAYYDSAVHRFNHYTTRTPKLHHGDTQDRKTGEESSCILYVTLATSWKTLTQYSSPIRLSIAHSSNTQGTQHRNSTVNTIPNLFLSDHCKLPHCWRYSHHILSPDDWFKFKVLSFLRQNNIILISVTRTVYVAVNTRTVLQMLNWMQNNVLVIRYHNIYLG